MENKRGVISNLNSEQYDSNEMLPGKSKLMLLFNQLFYVSLNFIAKDKVFDNDSLIA